MRHEQLALDRAVGGVYGALQGGRPRGDIV